METFDQKDIRAVVFDFDDTLVGTYKPIWALHKYIAKTHYQIELQDTDIISHWGKPVSELVRNLYQTQDTVLAVERVTQHIPFFPKEPFPHAAPALIKLKTAGKLIGIVSASTKQIIAQDVQICAFPQHLIDYLQTSEDTEFHKPNPRVFEPMLKWAAGAGIIPGQILYVGDGLLDYEAASRAGLNLLGVETGLVTAKEFAEIGASSIKNLGYLGPD